MNSERGQFSARIYQFPLKRRADVERAGGAALHGAVSTQACAGAWYHEAAIQEAERTRVAEPILRR